MSSIRPWQILLALVAAAAASFWALTAHAGIKKICNELTRACWYENEAGRIVMPRSKPRRVNRPRHRHHKKRRHRPEVRGYVRRDEEEDRVKCYDSVRVVGSQWATEDGAEESARKAWMERVRWSIGEAAMSIEAAEDYSKRCSRSSVGEVANTVLHRCEVQARPCRPVFETK